MNTQQIKANELRIGNLVNSSNRKKKDGSTYTGLRGPFKVEEIEQDRIKAIHLPDSIPFGMSYNSIEPIELTPDVLGRCGFTHTSDRGITTYNYGTNPITKDWILTLKWIEGMKAPFYRNGYFEIYSIHQLQNLVHALTGTELNYQP